MPPTWSLIQTTAPKELVVDLNELKRHLRITTTDDDELRTLAGYLLAAERAVEADLGVALLTQSWALRLPGFVAETIYLPRPPLVSVQSIQYVDSNGATQTLNSALYVVDIHGGGMATSAPGHVRPAWEESWPVTRIQPSAVTISYTAGRADATIPEAIRAAILLATADLHENRERMGQAVGLGAVKDTEIYERLVSDHRSLWEPQY